jgi:hypothetical protein
MGTPRQVQTPIDRIRDVAPKGGAREQPPIEAARGKIFISTR